MLPTTMQTVGGGSGGSDTSKKSGGSHLRINMGILVHSISVEFVEFSHIFASIADEFVNLYVFL